MYFKKIYLDLLTSINFYNEILFEWTCYYVQASQQIIHNDQHRLNRKTKIFQFVIFFFSSSSAGINVCLGFIFVLLPLFPLPFKNSSVENLAFFTFSRPSIFRSLVRNTKVKYKQKIFHRIVFSLVLLFSSSGLFEKRRKERTNDSRGQRKGS